MWTSPNDCIERPQIWDILHEQRAGRDQSAVWFPLHAKECGADYVCTPAPIHNPDGSESLWCYTRPASLYGELVAELGHFPLQHFWGPMANIKSTAWIVSSAIRAAERFRPNLFYILPAAPRLRGAEEWTRQRGGGAALAELDAEIGRLIDGFAAAYGDAPPLWLVASEYAITPVDHVLYPNRVLRDAGLLAVREPEAGERDRLRGKRGVGAGRSPVFARLRAGSRRGHDRARRGTACASSRASPKCSSRSERRSTT